MYKIWQANVENNFANDSYFLLADEMEMYLTSEEDVNIVQPSGCKSNYCQ